MLAALTTPTLAPTIPLLLALALILIRFRMDSNSSTMDTTLIHPVYLTLIPYLIRVL